MHRIACMVHTSRVLGCGPMLPEAQSHTCTGEESKFTRRQKGTIIKGRPPFCHHQCSRTAARPRAALPRCNVQSSTSVPTTWPKFEPGSRLCYFPRHCRSCAPRGRPLQLDTNKPIANIQYTTVMYTLSGANYNNYSPPREMRPRINYTRTVLS